jgi:hypothetical protein
MASTTRIPDTEKHVLVREYDDFSMRQKGRHEELEEQITESDRPMRRRMVMLNLVEMAIIGVADMDMVDDLSANQLTAFTSSVLAISGQRDNA